MSTLWDRFVAEARTEDWQDMLDVLGLPQPAPPVDYRRMVRAWADDLPAARWREIEILLAQREV